MAPLVGERLLEFTRRTDLGGHKVHGSSGVVSVLDRGVLADAATAFGVGWTPESEVDEGRRTRLVSCAQLVLYSAQRGIRLVALEKSRSELRGNLWLLATIDVVEDLSGSPGDADIEALAGIYRDDTLESDAAFQLAYCMLHERVQCLIVHDKHALRHSRDGDLPSRLLLLEPFVAVAELDLAPGEQPQDLPPHLSDVEPWWLPT